MIEESVGNYQLLVTGTQTKLVRIHMRDLMNEIMSTFSVLCVSLKLREVCECDRYTLYVHTLESGTIHTETTGFNSLSIPVMKSCIHDGHMNNHSLKQPLKTLQQQQLLRAHPS